MCVESFAASGVASADAGGRRHRFGGLLCLALAAGGGAVATAEAVPGAGDRESLRGRQAELFELLMAAPDDRELMREYARVSVELEDYEAVISTFERALIYVPNDPLLQMELGAAYYRLGAYQAARHHLSAARDAPQLTDDLRARIDDYLAAIDARTAESRFSGRASVGFVASTNANVGPDDRALSLLGQTVIIEDDATAQSDVGVRVVADLRHQYDLGRPALDFWLSEASFYSVRYFEEDRGDIDVFSVRTGPSLSVDERAYGPKIRPFVAGDYVRVDDKPEFAEIGGGAAYADTLSPEVNLFARTQVGWRHYFGSDDGGDGPTVRGLAGAEWRPAPGVSLTGGLFAELEEAKDDYRSNVEFGVRVGASMDYDPGIAEIGRPWTVGAYGRVALRRFDEPDPFIDPNETRHDFDLRLGAVHIFNVTESFGLQLDVDYLRRDSNITNFDLESLTGAVSVVYTF